jgi:outer membrane protein assembly factor BamB
MDTDAPGLPALHTRDEQAARSMQPPGPRRDADRSTRRKHVRERDRRVRAVAAIVLALLLSGCWLQAGGGPAATRFNSVETGLTRENAGSLAERWRTPIDGVVTEPLVSGDRIYVSTRRYQDSGPQLAMLAIQAYDRGSGELVWERPLYSPGDGDVSGGTATPALVDGELWVPHWLDGCAGTITRVDPATGAVIGADRTGRELSDLVRFGDAVAYVEAPCDGGTQLVVRDVATRAVRWTHRFADPGVVTPVVAEGRLFLLRRGDIHAFAADGCGAATCPPLWTAEDVGTAFDFLRPAAGRGGALVTVGQSAGPWSPATIVVRDAATGNVRWTAETRYTGTIPGAITGFAVAYDTVYVAGSHGEPEATDRTAVLDAYPLAGCGEAVCAPTWTTDLGATRPSAEPTVAGGVVYVPLVANYETAPAMVAVDASGCGSPSCPELARVPLVEPADAYLEGPQPYATSVASGRVVVAWSPDLYGSTQTELISLGAGDS